MRRLTEGYTIVEVMIVLAVGIALLVPAMLLIHNTQAHADFDQKVRDAQSQIQTWIGYVQSGYSGADHSNMNCTLVSGRPVIQAGATPPGYSPSCVFLGEAIQFTDSSYPGNGSLVYAYPVFGRLLDSSGQQPSDLRGTNPEPAAGWRGGVNLTQTLDLAPLNIVKVKSTGTDPFGAASTIADSHLVGFYNSINNDASTTANGQLDVNSYLYKNINSNQPPNAQPPPVSLLSQCLEMLSPCIPTHNYPDTLKSLAVCLSDGTRYVQLLITSSGGIGADVTVNYIKSLSNC